MNKPRVIGYMPLHYGKDYLKESLLSIIDHVEKFVVIYSETPSYGHGTNAVCPESEMELFNIAMSVCGDKLIWRKEKFGNEGEHRSFIYNFSEGYDLILAVDADEVFDNDSLLSALNEAYAGTARYYGINGYINFWRSFSYACYDQYLPIRITNLHNSEGQSSVKCKIYHFSCAQSNKIMDYKYLIHGHKDELKPNWLQNIYYAWTPENNFPDLHPVAIGLWNATLFDKSTMPEILKNHPNFNKHLIS